MQVAHAAYTTGKQGQSSLGGMTGESMWLNHPQGCMGFRLETKDGVHGLRHDNEPARILCVDRTYPQRCLTAAMGDLRRAHIPPKAYESGNADGDPAIGREEINVVMESGANELVLFTTIPTIRACIRQGS